MKKIKHRPGELFPTEFSFLCHKDRFEYLMLLKSLPTKDLSSNDDALLHSYWNDYKDFKIEKKNNLPTEKPVLRPDYVQKVKEDSSTEIVQPTTPEGVKLTGNRSIRWRVGEILLMNFYELDREQKYKHLAFLRGLPTEDLSTNDIHILLIHSSH